MEAFFNGFRLLFFHGLRAAATALCRVPGEIVEFGPESAGILPTAARRPKMLQIAAFDKKTALCRVSVTFPLRFRGGHYPSFQTGRQPTTIGPSGRGKRFRMISVLGFRMVSVLGGNVF